MKGDCEHTARKREIEDAMIERSEARSLPSVAGRMEMTHADFQRGCQLMLRNAQENPNCDTALVYLLCEAIRCSRECCEIATVRKQITFTASELEAMQRECSQQDVSETTSTVGDYAACKDVLRRVMQSAGVMKQEELI